MQETTRADVVILTGHNLGYVAMTSYIKLLKQRHKLVNVSYRLFRFVTTQLCKTY